MNLGNRAIIAAHQRGYRVTNEGVLLDPFGHLEPIKFDYRDATFTPLVDEKACRIPVKVHRFAAYCFYGKDLFTPNVIVSSRTDEVGDFSKTNLYLRTHPWLKR